MALPAKERGSEGVVGGVVRIAPDFVREVGRWGEVLVWEGEGEEREGGGGRSRV